MQVDLSNFVLLLQMQQVDLESLQIKRKLDKLPQKQAILDVRNKIKAVEEKSNQVEAMCSSAETRLKRVGEEDSSLVEKQHRIQKEIEEVSGDYRSVEARAKELNGCLKRRETLETQLESVTKELEKVKTVQTQVVQALDRLKQQEAVLVDSYIKEGGALKESAARLDAESARLSAAVPSDLLEIYRKVAARSAGVAVTRLQGSSCGACRTVIEPGRLADMKQQGNVGFCPCCGRLLILEQ